MKGVLLWFFAALLAGCSMPAPRPLKISGVTVSSITESQAAVHWATNNPSDSQVGFATISSANFEFTPCCEPTGTRSHLVILNGLRPATRYDFIARSFDSATHATSDAGDFTTEPPHRDPARDPRAGAGKASLPAFPGAQGAGAASVGGSGRAGGLPKVYEVVNLDDQGGACNGDKCSGSLRFCLEGLGPRTCVFRVSGLISPQSRLGVYNPYLTVAGQTAPGGAIVLGGPNQHGEVIFIATHDVVMRYLTYDGNNPNTPTGPRTGTVGFEIASGNAYNIVLDHISARWWGNKAFAQLSNDVGNDHNITYQWILAYEPHMTHPVGVGSDATAGSAFLTTEIDFHHNMFANIDHRLPFINGGRNIRWVNNLVYNWNQYAGLSNGGAQIDYIGNKYVDGNLSREKVHEFLANGNNDDPKDLSDNCIGSNPCDNPGPPGLYFLNNIGRHNAIATMVPNDDGQIAMTRQGWEGGETGDRNSTGPMPSTWFRKAPLPVEEFPIRVDRVDDLDSVLLATVGNSRRLDCDGNWVSNRDVHDARIIDQYKIRSEGAYFVGQFSSPAISTETPCASSLHDGILDAWKKAHGYSLTDGAFWSRKAANGYTYLENYLNGTNPAR
jgi:pectate lyase